MRLCDPLFLLCFLCFPLFFSLYLLLTELSAGSDDSWVLFFFFFFFFVKGTNGLSIIEQLSAAAISIYEAAKINMTALERFAQIWTETFCAARVLTYTFTGRAKSKQHVSCKYDVKGKYLHFCPSDLSVFHLNCCCCHWPQFSLFDCLWVSTLLLRSLILLLMGLLESCRAG